MMDPIVGIEVNACLGKNGDTNDMRYHIQINRMAHGVEYSECMVFS